MNKKVDGTVDITVQISKTVQEVPFHPVSVTLTGSVVVDVSDGREARRLLAKNIQDALDEIIAERRTTRCPFCYTFGADFDERTKCDDCPKETNDACRKASKPSGRR